jgi:Bacterial extracellular solute-binding protein
MLVYRRCLMKRTGTAGLKPHLVRDDRYHGAVRIARMKQPHLLVDGGTARRSGRAQHDNAAEASIAAIVASVRLWPPGKSWRSRNIGRSVFGTGPRAVSRPTRSLSMAEPSIAHAATSPRGVGVGIAQGGLFEGAGFGHALQARGARDERVGVHLQVERGMGEGSPGARAGVPQHARGASLRHARRNAGSAALQSGRHADVIVLTNGGLAELDGKGLVRRERAALATTGFGLATRSGDVAPDISTADALRAALLGASKVIYNDPKVTPSGQLLLRIAERLGVAEQVKAKSQVVEAGGGSRTAGGSRRDEIRAAASPPTDHPAMAPAPFDSIGGSLGTQSAICRIAERAGSTTLRRFSTSVACQLDIPPAATLAVQNKAMRDSSARPMHLPKAGNPIQQRRRRRFSRRSPRA